MQKSKKALKGLVCALKGIKPEEVMDVLVQNPIDLNDLSKETVMDLKLLLNNGTIMNIELQMYTDKFWSYRTILYLCRAFDSIKEGEDYSLLFTRLQLAPVTNSRIHSNSPSARNALTIASYSYAVSGVALPATFR